MFIKERKEERREEKGKIDNGREGKRRKEREGRI